MDSFEKLLNRFETLLNENEEEVDTYNVVPSLNSSAFNAAHGNYITTQEDVLATAIFIINKADEKTLSMLMKIANKRKQYFVHSRWQNRLLEKRETEFLDLIQKSKFEFLPGLSVLVLNFEVYELEIASDYVNINITDKSEWSIHGNPDKYEIVDNFLQNQNLLQLPDNLIRYMLFVWREVITAFSEQVDQGVKYNELGTITSSDEENIPENF